MARVVVTGGCGFVGSHLVDHLLRRGDEITVFDTGRPAADQPHTRADVRHVSGDIRDPDALAAVITPGVDTVYHLAAVVGVDRYLHRPMDVIDVNFSGTRAVLDLSTRAGAKVVFASTSEVFGKNPAVPWDEEADRVLGTTSANRWSYSTSKALAEHMTFAFIRQHGLNASIVRYFNLYGPRQRPAFLVSRSVHRALNGRPPIVYDDGLQTRSFTYIDDAISATVAIGASERADGESFNVGGTQEIPIRHVVELIMKLTELEGGFTRIVTKERFGDVYQDLVRRVPDTTKAFDLLGWKCATDLQQGIARTVDWAREARWWRELPDGSPD
jgi:UDP-glucose 4-epimerase